MVTALFQLYYSLATVASLPTLFFCHFYQAIGFLVLGTFPSCMEFTATEDAYFCLARATSCVLTAIRKIRADP